MSTTQNTQQRPVPPNTDQNDISLRSLWNHNTYASKKTLTQGMLDIALLAVNAAQLRFILVTWDYQEFSMILVCLVTASICLQVAQAIVCIILGLIFNINEVDDQKSANIISNISLCISVVVVAVNVIISAFDMKTQPKLL